MAITLDGSLGLTTPTYGGTTAAEYSVPVTSFKNRVINGAMQIAQRSTSVTNAGTAGAPYCTVDRFQIYRQTGASGLTASVSSTGGPTGLPYYSRLQRVAANAATNACQIAQSFENINCVDLVGQPVTFSVWIRAGANYSATSNAITINIAYGTGTNESIYNGFTGQTNTSSNVTLTTSWQQFTITGTVPSNATQVGVNVVYTPTGTAGTNDYFDITGFQLEKGSTATSFDQRSYGTELALCQRYFYYNACEVTGGAIIASGQWSTTTVSLLQQLHPVAMRATPSFSIIGTPQCGNSAGTRVGTYSSVANDGTNSKHIAVSITYTGTSGTAAGQATFLMGSGTSTTDGIQVSAELL